jgi:ribosomal protein S18 acetylase RimI-like enzyme
MQIREAKQQDHGALCGLWRQVDVLHVQLRPELFRDAPGLPRSERFLREVMRAQDQAVLVAEGNDGQLLGLVHVQVFDTPSEPQMVQRRRGHVEDLVVDAAYRRTGIGRALMAAAEEWCRDRGAFQLVLTVWTGNEEAERFYAELGYRPLSQVLGKPL